MKLTVHTRRNANSETFDKPISIEPADFALNEAAWMHQMLRSIAHESELSPVSFKDLALLLSCLRLLSKARGWSELAAQRVEDLDAAKVAALFDWVEKNLDDSSKTSAWKHRMSIHLRKAVKKFLISKGHSDLHRLFRIFISRFPAPPTVPRQLISDFVHEGSEGVDEYSIATLPHQTFKELKLKALSKLELDLKKVEDAAAAELRRHSELKVELKAIESGPVFPAVLEAFANVESSDGVPNRVLQTSQQPPAEQPSRAYLLPPAKAASIVGNLVSYLLHVPLDDRQVELLSSPDMACTLDVMLLPNGTPIAIPTFRSQGAEMRVLVPIVGAQARHWVKDCLLLRRMELLLAGKSRAGCLCISIENHARWFRAAAEGRPGSPRSRAPSSDLLEAVELLRERRSADIIEQSFFGVGASFGTADEPE